MNPDSSNLSAKERSFACVAIVFVSAIQFWVMTTQLKGLARILKIVGDSSWLSGATYRSTNLVAPATAAINHWNATASGFWVIAVWAMVLAWTNHRWSVYYLGASVAFWMLISSAVAVIF
jgi:hypothetical protein